MINIPDILDKFKTDLSNDIPALLSAESLDNFDKYVVGDSRNESERAICIYKQSASFGVTENILKLFFQLQLFSTDYETAEEYGQIVFDYLIDYDPADVGMNFINQIDSDSWPDEDNSTTFIFISLEYKESLDGCDQ